MWNVKYTFSFAHIYLIQFGISIKWMSVPKMMPSKWEKYKMEKKNIFFFTIQTSWKTSSSGTKGDKCMHEMEKNCTDSKRNRPKRGCIESSILCMALCNNSEV